MASKSLNIHWIKTGSQLCCKASYYRQFSTNIKIKNHKIHISFVSPDLRYLGVNKTGFDFYFNISKSWLYYDAIDNYYVHNYRSNNKLMNDTLDENSLKYPKLLS